MSRHLALLHTAESNVAVFETARLRLELPGLALHHYVRPDLLADCEAAGRLTPSTAERTRVELGRLAAAADAVVLTCSTLGPAAEGTTVIRVDAALARRAVRDGGRVVVLYALEATRGPTSDLFHAAAAATGAKVKIQFVPGAWPAFRNDHIGSYLQLVAAAADAATIAGADVVALAQASMDGAASRCTAGGTVLTSPNEGLLAALG